MKSAFAAFATVVAGVLLGWLTFGLLDMRGASGRDATPLMLVAALFLVATGTAFGMLWFRRLRDCLAGLAAYAVVVGVLVVYFSGGLAIPAFFFDWLFMVLAATLVPWTVGALIGRWVRRTQAT